MGNVRINKDSYRLILKKPKNTKQLKKKLRKIESIENFETEKPQHNMGEKNSQSISSNALRVNKSNNLQTGRTSSLP